MKGSTASLSEMRVFPTVWKTIHRSGTNSSDDPAVKYTGNFGRLE